MFLASLLIGLREGLEASLIIGILLAYVRKRDRTDVVPRIWWGVGSAVVGSLVLGAVLTYGAYGLSFQGQEILGGSMSLLAVGMVTWMVFWMMKTGHRLKGQLEGDADGALAVGTGSALAWIAFVSVGREGVETTLMLWGWAGQWQALVGAVLGFVLAAGIGYLLYRGMVRINFGSFFAWTGAFLLVVAAGILAYGIHDLQEAAVLPGPFSGHPITPTDLRTGEVLVGLTDGPFWLAAYPFGWAFDVSASVDPAGVLATFAKGTVGWTPQMSWLEVTCWAIYLIVVLPRFFGAVRRNRAAQAARQSARRPGADAVTPPPAAPTADPAPTTFDQPSPARAERPTLVAADERNS